MLNASDLFDIARIKSAEGRNRLAEVVTDLFLDEGDLTDVERSLMFEILHKILRDIELSVREDLSKRLADLPDVPRELARDLANDQIQVAQPILSRSKALWDEDLVEVVYNRTLEHRMAVAIRDDVSEDVSYALISSGDEDVIRTLLENPNAEISKSTMEYVVEQSKRYNSFQEPLIHRDDLPVDLGRKMYMWVAAALRKNILDRYRFDETELDAMMNELAANKISELAEEANEPQKIDFLIQDLKEDGSLTADLMRRALEEGVVPLFFAVFQELTGLNEKISKRIVFEPRGEGMAIACKAIDVEASVFEDIFTLSRNSRVQTAKVQRKEVRKVMDLYDNMTPVNAGKVLSMWRCGSEYLAAIRELEL